MSHEDKRRLKKRAEEAGMTVQGYLEHVALGYDPAPPRRPGPVPQRRREVQEELDISA
ncbi:plasmid mobilization protein [Microlunatus aurantiacus]